MKRILLLVISVFFCIGLWAENDISLTLIPPGKITNKVKLDIRGGIINKSSSQKTYRVAIYWGKEKRNALLHEESVVVPAGKSEVVKVVIPTREHIGKHKIILKVSDGNKTYRKTKDIEVVESEIRSIRQISGAWAGIYHWSEVEGKHWNKDIKKMTDNQWKELVRSMHKVEMDMIVVQEVFRNEQYVGKHNTTVESYTGKAFYPSRLYSGRMEIAAKDPIEAILSEADRLGMNVLIGVGMFAWFDFTKESLEWHKRVAKELWDMYGHHSSFYAFYISEENSGGLDNYDGNPIMQQIRKREIVDFFKEFKSYCRSFAPDKPIMLATSSFDVLKAVDTYPCLMENLDILCPFGFARMPEGDLDGGEVATILQNICDKANAHLWFDLEAFLFNADNSLYPRPIDEIIKDLNKFDNFEKILCYQFPGVFNDPMMSVCIGEERTKELYIKYKKYIDNLKR